jgi:molecular chaperone HtpG
LEEYVGRLKEDQKNIYFILGDDPKAVLRSPHLDYYQAQGVEVLLLTEPIDSFMLMGLHKYKDFELKNVALAETDTPEKAEDKAEEKEKPSDPGFETMIQHFKEVLGDRVADVRQSERLSQSVARLVEPEGGMNQEMQRVYKYLGKDFEATKKILELNPAHPILKNLANLQPESALHKMVIEQIFDSALLVEGLHPDPSSMVQRVQDIIQAALEKG